MYVTPWKEVKIIMLGEISQSLRDKYCLGSLIREAFRCQSQGVQCHLQLTKRQEKV